MDNRHHSHQGINVMKRITVLIVYIVRAKVIRSFIANFAVKTKKVGGRGQRIQFYHTNTRLSTQTLWIGKHFPKIQEHNNLQV